MNMVKLDDRRETCAARVYALLGQIPVGRVVTYGQLARAANCGSARAMGSILRRNPDAPRVPCHRVIRSDGTLGGYQGELGGSAVARKLRLLEEEGVAFRDGKLLESERFWHFPKKGGAR